MNRAHVKEWTTALRSGNYSQISEALTNEDGFCCLGVLCVVADIPLDPDNNSFEGEDSILPLRAGLWLEAEVTESWDPVVNIEGYSVNDQEPSNVKVAKHHGVHATVLNDRWELTFDQIADMVDYFGLVDPS